MITSKGVGDLIDAIAIAHAKGESYRAVLVGRGSDLEKMQAKVHKLGVGDSINFAGLVARSRVIELMHAGEIVVVPSRHEYPEGIPHTIYEGLLSRSPLVVSDHPMFGARIEHGRSGVLFKASNPQSLYETVHDLVNNADLYERLSRDGDHLARNFHGPLKWDQVVTRWLNGSAADDAWLRQYALLS
jgi:glycosyltransferase involved in cell wall biosynthesis